MKPTHLRYIYVVLYFLVAAFVMHIYYGSPLYDNPYANGQGGFFDDFISMFLTIALILAGKYFIYDSLASIVRRKYPNLVATIIFYICFVGVLLFDTNILFVASAPVTDSGFAMLAAVIITPPALLVSLLLVIAVSLIPSLGKLARKKQSSVSRSE